MTILHPFESQGLGLAPFRLHSVVSGALRGCAYCGTAIKVHCHIRSADGKTFIVGSDCVRRVAEKVDTTLALDVRRAHDDLLREQREAKREARWNALQARVRAVRDVLTQNPEWFTSQKHPDAHLATKGLTFRDYCTWVLQHGGMQGRAYVCAVIEAKQQRANAVNV